MTNERPNCTTCHHFYQAADASEYAKQQQVGQCRRFPPTFHGEDGDCFPFVDGTAWCGEWSALEYAVTKRKEKL